MPEPSKHEKSDKPHGTFTSLNRQRLIQYFFFGVFLLLLYQLARMLSPFFVAILGAAILALIVYPLHARVLARLKAYPSSAAVVTTALVVLIVVLPASLLGWVFVRETAKVYPAATEWVEKIRNIHSNPQALTIPESIRGAWEKSRTFFDFWNIDPEDIFLKNLDEMSSRMSDMTTTLIKDMVFLTFNLMVLTFVLFFFLRDGPTIIRRVMELVPLEPDHKHVILVRIQETLYGVLRGVLTVAAVQGFLTGLGFKMFGVPFPVLLGVLTTLLSPIPIIGGAGVWIPVVIGLTLVGETRTALQVAAWCAIVVNAAEHILRPILIGAHAKIPILLLFFGLLGGLRIYGFMGLLLGPLVVALVLAFINIYRQEYRWLLQRAPEKPS